MESSPNHQKMRNFWKIAALMFALVALAEGIWIAKNYPRYQRLLARFEPRKDPSPISPAQLKDLPPESEQVLLIRKSLSSAGFQTEISTTMPTDPKTQKLLGRLYTRDFPPFITVALYLCKAKRDNAESIFLNHSPECPGQGSLLSTSPVGFASGKSLPGLIPLYRCFRKNAGVYHSHNSLCEDPEDEFDGLMGFVRAPI